MRAWLIVLVALVAAPLQAAEVSGPAPDFTLASRDAGNIKLSELRGEVVMLNWWASWCGPCRQEMPLLDDLQKKYRDYGFTLLGINVDENTDQARKLLGQIPVEFTILFDPQSQTSEQYGIDAMPSTILIDRNGNMRFLHRGYKPGYEDDYDAQVKALVLE